jgi:hypothetical protein
LWLVRALARRVALILLLIRLPLLGRPLVLRPRVVRFVFAVRLRPAVDEVGTSLVVFVICICISGLPGGRLAGARWFRRGVVGRGIPIPPRLSIAGGGCCLSCLRWWCVRGNRRWSPQ